MNPNAAKKLERRILFGCLCLVLLCAWMVSQAVRSVTHPVSDPVNDGANNVIPDITGPEAQKVPPVRKFKTKYWSDEHSETNQPA